MADLTGKTLGNYEIIKLLGKGGMAVVYLARQTNMKREVAVKVIESDLAQSAEFVRRFEREVDTIASFSNAHILKVFDYGKAEGAVYLVMELLRGGSLADKIRAGAMPLSTVRKLLNQIASALDYAHRRGIVHRDLKPQNVMLDEDGNAFLTDFGIAKVMSGGTTITMATSAGTILGTPAYMAPEQWKSQPVDARTDIYALGIMLYEMLTGSLPFNSDTAYGLMHKHVNEAPPIRTMDRRFASGIERVLIKALEKNPDDRYSSSMQLVREFEAAIQRHGLGESPYADAATQSGEGEIELIELEPLSFDDTFAKRPVDAELLRPISSPMSDTHLKTGTLSLKPEAAAPPPSTPSVSTPQARSSVPLIIGLLVLLGLGGIGAVLLTRGGSTPTPTTAPTAVVLAPTDTATSTLTTTITPSSTVTSTITPTATNTDEPGVQTQVALTLTERATQTLIVQASYTKTATPNRQQTAAAQIAQLDTATSDAATANAIASYTKTSTPTFTATKTATATYTATATFTNTATATATLTATLTLTPVPCVISTTGNNARAHLGPSRQRNVIGNLVPGTNYTATRQAVDTDKKVWVQITFRNQQLWVMLADVTSTGDCANLPSFEATATPTPTFTVTRTLTPSITPPPGAVCIITTPQENVRAHLGPSRQRNTIGFLAPNTPYAPISLATDSDGNKWVEITLTLGTRTQQLWVMLSDVTVQGDCDQLPSAGAATQGNTGATARATFPNTATVPPSAIPSSTRTLASTATTAASATQTLTNTATVAASATPTLTSTVTTVASATRTSTSTVTVAASATKTPSPSATVTAVATTAAVLTTVSATQGGACTITTTVIDTRVHLGPSRLRNVMGNLKANTPYTVISRVVDADKKTWVEVKLNNKQGWVFLDEVTARGACDQVPTPTATVAK